MYLLCEVTKIFKKLCLGWLVVNTRTIYLIFAFCLKVQFRMEETMQSLVLGLEVIVLMRLKSIFGMRIIVFTSNKNRLLIFYSHARNLVRHFLRY